ncbi:hypothetical protein EZV61_17310 [Corallincola luteus]|uniref:Uncharacterized protein n=1 Tax=Corallincola luteus TaxID=1775177 RepID=A0ABY2AHN2_9GAMM|nr:hypothetical protein [Corallincola luteus]TCI01729.1 hypothetical protein EZV61_17310 [Corallincola luteus]
MQNIINLFRRLFQRTQPKQLPLIDVDSAGLKRVYWLTDKLKDDPSRVAETRKLTLNSAKPFLGLNGTYGLYASSKWWDSINKGIMPTRFVSGTINRVYESGQDEMGVLNTVDLETVSGGTASIGIFVNDPADISLFIVGAKVTVVYAEDELKRKDGNGRRSVASLTLEMAVSCK